MAMEKLTDLMKALTETARCREELEKCKNEHELEVAELKKEHESKVKELELKIKALDKNIDALQHENNLIRPENDRLKDELEKTNIKLMEINLEKNSPTSQERIAAEERTAFENMKAKVEAREIAVAAREKKFAEIEESLVKASAELASKQAERFSAVEKSASELYTKRIAETEEQVQSMLDSARTDARKLRKEASLSAEQIRSEAQEEKERIIKTANTEAQGIIDKAKSDTAALEHQITELTKKIAELSGDNTKLLSQNEALSSDKETLLSEIKSQKTEFDAITATYAKTMANFETIKIQLEENGKSVADFSKEIADMDTREQKLNAFEGELKKRNEELSSEKERNEARRQQLDERESDIDTEIETRYSDIIDAKKRDIETLQTELENQRESRVSAEKILNAFKDIKADLGDRNPIAVLEELNAVKAELSTLRDDMNNPASYINKKATDLREQEDKLAERMAALEQKERANAELHDDYARIQAENSGLKLKYEEIEKDKKFVEDQLQRLRATYENSSPREERIKEINKPLIKKDLPRLRDNKISELEWLDRINNKIEESNLHFPRRILNAFHTALKTSEMSPITVLAGVSGTGKSELPRLYSRFGGINFLSVPVQPNWDCQEAMLGYYNSIDNCFEATDILRLLAQSQRNPNPDPEDLGMNDVMTMVLLDEMNLANVELYFAEFLSKLETRRGLSDSDPNFPKIGVKVGSKMPDWPLNLGRNVLWTGTMNNDETTKTLSDKVLDRGIVINFPRPKELRSRRNSVLPEPSELLPKSVWSSWVRGYDFSSEEIQEYKETVEKINTELGKTGRAIGHRVWQSIENYMSLYPDVIAAKTENERKRAMKNAFEDQVVQKIMPKLRGLETRGSQEEVLTSIKGILTDKVSEAFHTDFKNAMEQNYGQFIWTTSDYLLQEEGKQETPETQESKLEESTPENPLLAEAVEAVNSGKLQRDKKAIKEFLGNHFTKDLLHDILLKTKE